MIKRDNIPTGAISTHLLQSSHFAKQLSTKLRNHVEATKGTKMIYSLSANGHGMIYSTMVLTCRIEADGEKPAEIRNFHVNFFKSGKMDTQREAIVATKNFLAKLHIKPIFVLHDGSIFDMSIEDMVEPFQHAARDLLFYLRNNDFTKRIGNFGEYEIKTLWMGSIFEASWKYDPDDIFQAKHDQALSEQILRFQKLSSDRMVPAQRLVYQVDLGVFDSENRDAVKKEVERLMPEDENGKTCLDGIILPNGDAACQGMRSTIDDIWSIMRFMWARREGAINMELTNAVTDAMRRLIKLIEQTKQYPHASLAAMPNKELIIRNLSTYAAALENHGELLRWEVIDFMCDYELSCTTATTMDSLVVAKRLIEGEIYGEGYTNWVGSTPHRLVFIAILPGMKVEALRLQLENFFGEKRKEKKQQKEKE